MTEELARKIVEYCRATQNDPGRIYLGKKQWKQHKREIREGFDGAIRLCGYWRVFRVNEEDHCEVFSWREG